MKNNYIIFKKITGIILILIGIIGLFLPFLQGFLFIATGLTLIGNKKLLYLLKKYSIKIRSFLQKKI